MATSIDYDMLSDLITTVATQIADAAKRPRIINLRSSKNSLGENVISWDLFDGGGNANTFIIIATYDGATAPLGAIPAVPNTTSYKFADSVLNRYVGKKTYRIVIERRDGTCQIEPAKVSSTVAMTTSPEYFR
jgi:hypothetical protein